MMQGYCSICGAKIDKAHTDENGKVWYLQICSVQCGKEAFGQLTENMRTLKTTILPTMRSETKRIGNYSEETLKKMTILRSSGWSYNRIGKKLRIAPSAVRYQIIKMQKEAAESAETI